MKRDECKKDNVMQMIPYIVYEEMCTKHEERERKYVDLIITLTSCIVALGIALVAMI
jgi:hypothetical protein